MEAAGADDQVELLDRRVLERHPRTLVVLFDRRDGVAEDRPHLSVERFINQFRKVAAQNAQVTISKHRLKRACAETACPPAFLIDDADLVDLVALAPERRQQAHPIGDVEAAAPEVDDVAAGAQRRRTLDQHRLEAVAQEPIGETWPPDPRARYENLTVIHSRPVH